MTVVRDKPKRPKETKTPVVRCAIYTRKSTEEGLEQEFNTLDAQRQAAEDYIRSQRARGWVALPERYDDGGFTGANLNRPAMERLIADVEDGRVDCVVVYKVDRLSRSIIDFAGTMKFFDTHGVNFVSVTQSFNTAESSGRLMLNILSSFSQYEREMISERTRDKMRAARRKGKWTGGWPPLGYDVTPEGGRLVVNEVEAGQVRSLFRLYLERRSVPAVAREANRRGWTTKSWTTRAGKRRPGKPFTKNFMYKLLRNRLYAGYISLGAETYKGEHEAIIDKATWDKVQAFLGENGSTGGRNVRNMHGALLKGIIYCGSCGCPMTHVHTKKRTRVYRYYVCRKAQKEGWKTCPTKSVSAPDIEQFVLDRVKAMGKDPALKAEVVANIQAQKDTGLASLQNEKTLLNSQVRRRKDEIRSLVASLAEDGSSASSIATRLGELERENSTAVTRLAGLDKEISALNSSEVDEDAVTKALEAFDPVWDELFPLERVRILQLVVKRVTYDGEAGTVSLDLYETGIATLAEEMRAAEAEANGKKEE